MDAALTLSGCEGFAFAALACPSGTGFVEATLMLQPFSPSLLLTDPLVSLLAGGADALLSC